MRKILVLLAVIIGLLWIGLVNPSQAQTNISVNINRTDLIWEWTQGQPPDDGVAEKFTVKCGQATGVYTKLTDVSFPNRILPVRQAITGNGNWFCVVTASNQFGESGASNEIPFAAGAPPSSPLGAKLQSR